jgi:hypothetical protein
LILKFANVIVATPVDQIRNKIQILVNVHYAQIAVQQDEYRIQILVFVNVMLVVGQTLIKIQILVRVSPAQTLVRQVGHLTQTLVLALAATLVDRIRI